MITIDSFIKYYNESSNTHFYISLLNRFMMKFFYSLNNY